MLYILVGTGFFGFWGEDPRPNPIGFSRWVGPPVELDTPIQKGPWIHKKKESRIHQKIKRQKSEFY